MVNWTNRPSIESDVCFCFLNVHFCVEIIHAVCRKSYSRTCTTCCICSPKWQNRGDRCSKPHPSMISNDVIEWCVTHKLKGAYVAMATQHREGKFSELRLLYQPQNSSKTETILSNTLMCSSKLWVLLVISQIKSLCLIIIYILSSVLEFHSLKENELIFLTWLLLVMFKRFIIIHLVSSWILLRQDQNKSWVLYYGSMVWP